MLKMALANIFKRGITFTQASLLYSLVGLAAAEEQSILDNATVSTSNGIVR